MILNYLRPMKLFPLTFLISLQVFAGSPTEENGHPKHHTNEGFRNYPVIENSENLGFKFYWKRFISSFNHPNVPENHFLSDNKVPLFMKSYEMRTQ